MNNMNNMTNTLPSSPNYQALETSVRNAASRAVASINAWLTSCWSKAIATLEIAFPVPGDGMH